MEQINDPTLKDMKKSLGKLVLNAIFIIVCTFSFVLSFVYTLLMTLFMFLDIGDFIPEPPLILLLTIAAWSFKKELEQK